MTVIRSLDKFAKSVADLIPELVLSLSARFSLFMVFWFSAQNMLSGSRVLGQKWMFWNLSSATLTLFRYEYTIPLIPSTVAAYVITITEFFLSLLLLIGLFTRMSALGLALVTIVIQVFIHPENWSLHLLWTVALLYLLKGGGGRLSVDALARQ